jgi:D-aminoacyl-tRNA deacylase
MFGGLKMVRFAIIATEKDTASKNIGKKIVELGGFQKSEDKPYPTFKKGNDILVWHPEDLVFATDLSEHYDPECFVFVFRHKAENPKPMLTVHVTGNLNSEPMRAGNPYELGISHPSYMFKVLNGLKKYAPEGYSISYEATHHSPTNLIKPLMFVEIGSSEEQWNDSRAVEAVAKAILDLLENPQTKCTSCIGLGGGHYVDRFTRRAFEKNYAFGHIIPSYEFEKTKSEVIQQAIDKTIGIQKAVLDQRSQGKEEERKAILEVMKKNQIEVIKLK